MQCTIIDMKPFLVYNWKTYIATASDAATLAGALEDSNKVEVVVCPSALHIQDVAKTIHGKNIALGAQDISISPDNPRTGNISGAQAAAAGMSHTIVGHAETRAAGVTNPMVADKTQHALLSGLTPILCLSEQEEDEDGDGEEVAQQLEEVLRLNKEELQKKSGNAPRIIVAYEPTAYIGAQDALAPEKIKHTTDLLRVVLSKNSIQDTPILYGGSVSVENAEGIIETAGANGFLLGRASTNAETANTILHTL